VCEIFILVSMCRYLHRTATNKGQPGWPFVLLMIFAWFVGGIGGGIAGIATLGDDSDGRFGFIIGYLIGVSIACIGNALIVALLPDRTRDEERYRYEDERDYTDRRSRYGDAPRGRLADEDEYDDRDRDRDYRGDREERDDREWRRRNWDDR
jgi:hypothetical protein